MTIEKSEIEKTKQKKTWLVSITFTIFNHFLQYWGHKNNNKIRLT